MAERATLTVQSVQPVVRQPIIASMLLSHVFDHSVLCTLDACQSVKAKGIHRCDLVLVLWSAIARASECSTVEDHHPLY